MDSEEISHVDSCEAMSPGKGNSGCKGPEAGADVAGSGAARGHWPEQHEPKDVSSREWEGSQGRIPEGPRRAQGGLWLLLSMGWEPSERSEHRNVTVKHAMTGFRWFLSGEWAIRGRSKRLLTKLKQETMVAHATVVALEVVRSQASDIL